MNRVSIYVAGAVHWRQWLGEELHEVRVTCNEQDVLETAVEVTESPACIAKTHTRLTAMHLLQAAHTTLKNIT